MSRGARNDVPDAELAAGTSALVKLGVAHPKRVERLMREVIDRLALDLSGLNVLTEVGSGNFALTPAIAGAAGAERVVAFTRDSAYGRADDNVAAGRAIAALCGAASRIEFVHGRPDRAAIARADVVTNLGFVRPIDAAFVAELKSTAVVALMCEAWEWRPADVDLAACEARGIPVFGTNEDAPGVEVFSFSGPLAGALLFEAGLEVHKCRVVVVSPDRFGGVVADWLRRAGAQVTMVERLSARTAEVETALGSADAVLLADYSRAGSVVGDADGDITAAELAKAAPSAIVVQFAGAVDAEGLRRHGVPVYPESPVGPVRMSRTLAHLGPRPVIELHAAGLKVGELGARARLRGATASEVARDLPRAAPLVQAVRPILS